MLLTPYRNPPYRMPTVNHAAARHESPKRKRTDSTSAPAPVAQLKVDTSFDSGSEVEPGLDSPRSKVADRLERLDLKQQQVDGAGIAEDAEDAAPRKKLKTKRRAAFNEDALPHQQRTPARPDFNVPRLGDQQELEEVMETPDCRLPATRTFTPSTAVTSPLPDHQSPFVQITPHKPGNSSPPAKISPKRMRSPPPPQPSSAPFPPLSLPNADSQGSAGQDSLDPATLTWQDTEITGHEIDASADDDGEGINGVGFRPTPAIAYARSQKRKQQVSEWRAREAREARQRRFQRRQGCAADVQGNADEAKVVRFAGFG